MLTDILRQLARNEIIVGVSIILVILELFLTIILALQLYLTKAEAKKKVIAHKKNNRKKHFQKIRTLFSFPHVWICVGIILTAVITVYISWRLDGVHNFLSSIFANIFAGLVTGLAICLISGAKQIAILQMQGKRTWLCELAQMLKTYLSDYHKLIQYKFDKFDGNPDDFTFFYDMSIHASDINSFVTQSSFNKTLAFNPQIFCLSNMGYDAEKMAAKFDLLHEKVEMIEIDLPSSKAIEGYFRQIHPDLRNLNSAVHSAINDLDMRLADIQKTIV